MKILLRQLIEQEQLLKRFLNTFNKVVAKLPTFRLAFKESN